MLRLLASIEPRFPVEVFQLDEMPDGSDIQAALLKLNSCMTVPQVFIGGKYVGGCTETTELHDNKKLEPAISDAVAAHASGELGGSAVETETSDVATAETSEVDDPSMGEDDAADGNSESDAIASEAMA